MKILDIYFAALKESFKACPFVLQNLSLSLLSVIFSSLTLGISYRLFKFFFFDISTCNPNLILLIWIALFVFIKIKLARKLNAF